MPRGAGWLLSAVLALVSTAGQATDPPHIIGARLAEPTDRYGHRVLGHIPNHGAMELTTGRADGTAGQTRIIRLPHERVFEDVAPRLADVTGDGRNEVVVVESDLSRGARLSVYGIDGLVAATPFIGTPNRWLAPVAIADLSGDGQTEIAFVDRPHLRRTLMIWTFADGALDLVAELPGITNHRIGEPFISGGLRDCGAGPEMVVASADWEALLALTFDGTSVSRRVLGRDSSPEGFAAALACRD